MGPGQRPARGAAAGAFLELVPTGQRWALYEGTNTIGRSEACQVFLDIPLVQEKRLVSGQHAYIRIEGGVSVLYDGSPDGRPSSNGTYVNLRRVPPGGYRLQNGDAIVLAAIDPLYPRSDTPGVVTFYFWTDRGN
jgi:pSer/pThr/pTyr-binding forkhead associated (FHA) protein